MSLKTRLSLQRSIHSQSYFFFLHFFLLTDLPTVSSHAIETPRSALDSISSVHVAHSLSQARGAPRSMHYSVPLSRSSAPPPGRSIRSADGVRRREGEIRKRLGPKIIRPSGRDSPPERRVEASWRCSYCKSALLHCCTVAPMARQERCLSLRGFTPSEDLRPGSYEAFGDIEQLGRGVPQMFCAGPRTT